MSSPLSGPRGEVITLGGGRQIMAPFGCVRDGRSIWDNDISGEWGSLKIDPLFDPNFVQDPMLSLKNSPFQRFHFQLVKRAKCNLQVMACSSTNMFPCSLPFPDAERGADRPKSARRRQRFLQNRHAMRWVNSLFALFSFMEMGSPEDPPDFDGVLKVESQTVLKAARSLLCEVKTFRRAGRGLSLEDGQLPAGARQKVCDLLKSKGKPSSYGKEFDPSSVSEDIIPDCVSLPERAGLVDPRPFLNSEQLQVYNNMRSLLIDPPPGEEIPKACHMVEPQDEDDLADRLLSCGMAVLVEGSLIPKLPSGLPLKGGLFGVPKGFKNGRRRQRLIFDRRPQNSMNKRVRWGRLPHACQLGRIVLKS